MTAKPVAIESLSAKKEEQATNGWEKLLPLLDPTVVNLPRHKDSWKNLDKELVFYLTHTVAKFPWINHLALAGLILQNEGGLARPVQPLSAIHAFCYGQSQLIIQMSWLLNRRKL